MSPPPMQDVEARTELAWGRSGLALLACFAILARRVWASGTERGDVLAVVVLALGALGWALGVLGFRLARRRADAPRPRSAAELGAVALGTAAVGLAGVIIAVVNV